jgi:hypothetical protein
MAITGTGYWSHNAFPRPYKATSTGTLKMALLTAVPSTVPCISPMCQPTKRLALGYTFSGAAV